MRTKARLSAARVSLRKMQLFIQLQYAAEVLVRAPERTKKTFDESYELGKLKLNGKTKKIVWKNHTNNYQGYLSRAKHRSREEI